MPRSERCRIRGNCVHGIALPSRAQAPVAGGAPVEGPRPKTAVAAALAALILAAVTPAAQAMPVAPHHSVFAGLNADLQDAQWQRYWRDRWGWLRRGRGLK